MAEATAPDNIIVSLQLEDATSIFFEPGLKYENIVQNRAGIYKIIPGVKHKVKMRHLDDIEDVLQPKSDCNQWNPSLSAKWRTDELTVCPFEMEAEQCADDFLAGCTNNMTGAGNMMNDLNATQPLTQLQMAVLMLYKKAIIDDMYQIAWFGAEDFGTADDLWHSDLNHLDVNTRQRLIKKLRHCNGFWNEIEDRVQLPETDLGYIRWVDTNDGTAEGNMTLPSNITTFFNRMIDSSSVKLMTWKANHPTNQRPVFLLQRELYKAYITFLTSTGTEAAHMLIINGTPVEGFYTYDGYPVVEVVEWMMFDVKIGARGKNVRALFTAMENLTIGFDVMELSEYANTSIVVWKSPDPRDKGKVIFWAALRMGMRIARPELMTAAYNSSTIFVAA